MDDVRARPRRPWSAVRDAVVVIAEYTAESVYGLLHPAWRNSGTTESEGSERLPGDELIRESNWQATRAITIEATPEMVWPWLMQMGYGRGGWYGDLPWWKDPQGHAGQASSSWHLLTPAPQLSVGDVLLDGPNCDDATGAWRVVALDPGRLLVLFSARTLSGREVPEHGPRPRSWFACSWAFVLRPTGDGMCRLVMRTRIRYRPAWMVRAAAVLRTGDTVMQRAMLIGIKRRVEAAVRTSGGMPPEPGGR